MMPQPDRTDPKAHGQATRPYRGPWSGGGGTQGEGRGLETQRWEGKYVNMDKK